MKLQMRSRKKRGKGQNPPVYNVVIKRHLPLAKLIGFTLENIIDGNDGAYQQYQNGNGVADDIRNMIETLCLFALEKAKVEIPAELEAELTVGDV